MRGRQAVLFLVASLPAGVLHAADPLPERTPAEVVNHHIAAMLSGDRAALIEDYADDAVVVFATTILNGKRDIQKMFGAAGARSAADDGAVMKVASASGDVVVEEYTHRAPGGTVSGKDVFVVRHGKIVFHATQTSTVTPPPVTTTAPSTGR